MLLPADPQTMGFGGELNFGPLKKALAIWEAKRFPGVDNSWQAQKGRFRVNDKPAPQPAQASKRRTLSAEEKHERQKAQKRAQGARLRQKAAERRWELMTPEEIEADKARSERIRQTQAAIKAGLLTPEQRAEQRRADKRASYHRVQARKLSTGVS